MRFADIFTFALGALGQQKVRAVLTTLGVVLGTFLLVSSLSVGMGVREAIGRQFRQQGRLRQVDVWPAWKPAEAGIPPGELAVEGAMSEAKRKRIRQAKIDRWTYGRPAVEEVSLTPERLRKLEAIEHVAAVVPYFDQHGQASFGPKTEVVRCTAAPPGDGHHQGRIVAGRFFSAADGRAVVVSEYLLYRWGIRDDAQVSQVLNQPVRLEFRSGGTPELLRNLINPGGPPLTPAEEKVLEKALRELPDALGDRLEPAERDVLQRLLKAPGVPRPGAETVVSETFTIVGVLRGPAPGDAPGRWPLLAVTEDIVLPLKAAEELLARFPGARPHRFDAAAVTVDSEEHVREVVNQVAAEGLGHFSLVDLLEELQRTVFWISFAMAVLALVALVIAALGIINTMLMTVLERTHEIGVMKAVGARDGHVQVIFLVEGAVIGLAGGCVGLVLSWLFSFPVDAVARSLMEQQAPFPETLFAFPWWLVLGVPLFASLVTTLAAVVPARRAAHISPITALRHE